MYIVSLFILMLLAVQQGGEQSNGAATPHVMPSLCNFAKINRKGPQSKVSVRSGPGSKFSQIDTLHDGAVVYTCDEGRGWYKVSYGDANSPCGIASPDGLDMHKTTGCKSGWVKREWIEVLSG